MDALPFASKTPTYSVWGCGDLSGSVPSASTCPLPKVQSGNAGNAKIGSADQSTKEDSCPATNYEYMPAVLLNSLKRDKKPFTYTPGRMDLSEVLNDKLRKRMHRRQIRAEERAMPQNSVLELPTFESQKQVLVMPTYNSPLDMYSVENALEALEVQAEISVADKSHSIPRCHSMTLPRNYKFHYEEFEPKNVAQSKAFRVLQIITDTDEGDPAASVPQISPDHHQHRDLVPVLETKSCNRIPSKYFHNLQKMTNTNDTERFSEPADMKRDEAYFEDEMRFSGIRPSHDIPSKLFHNLQKITGTQDRPRSMSDKQKLPERHVHFQSQDGVKMLAKETYSSSVVNDGFGNQKSGCALQRPAAFLPSNQAKHVPFPRFNATNVSKCQSGHLLGT